MRSETEALKERFKLSLQRHPRPLLDYKNPYEGWLESDRVFRILEELEFRLKNPIPISSSEKKENFDRGSPRDFSIDIKDSQGEQTIIWIGVYNSKAYLQSQQIDLGKRTPCVKISLQNLEPVVDGEIRLSVLLMCGLVWGDEGAVQELIKLV